MMVAATNASAQRVSLGSVVPIRSVPLPAWTYLPQAERPTSIAPTTTGALVTLAQVTGALGAFLRHAPGADEVLPRLAGWALTRAAAAEGAVWSGDSVRDAGAGAPAGSAESCWRLALTDWARVTGLSAAPRRNASWIGPSARLQGGASTVPPPPHMLKDALVSWQRAVDSSGGAGEVEVIRAALDAAWSMWCIHFLQPVDHSSGLLARLTAARIFAVRAGLPGMPIVPVDSSVPLRAEDSADLALSYESWVLMAMHGLAADAARVLAGLERVRAGRAVMLEAARAMRAPRHPTMLAHAFLANPRMTMQDAARAMGISFRAAQAVMGKFLESGLVHEDTGRRRDRIYVCDGVMFDAPAQGERLPEPSAR